MRSSTKLENKKEANRNIGAEECRDELKNSTDIHQQTRPSRRKNQSVRRQINLNYPVRGEKRKKNRKESDKGLTPKIYRELIQLNSKQNQTKIKKKKHHTTTQTIRF